MVTDAISLSFFSLGRGEPACRDAEEGYRSHLKSIKQASHVLALKLQVQRAPDVHESLRLVRLYELVSQVGQACLHVASVFALLSQIGS